MQSSKFPRQLTTIKNTTFKQVSYMRARTHAMHACTHAPKHACKQASTHARTRVQVECGELHTVAVTEAGAVYTWGEGQGGR